MVNEIKPQPDPQHIMELLGGMFVSEGICVPDIFKLYERHPAFLSDFYMNFKRFVWIDGYNNVNVKCLIGLAVSFATRCRPWADFFTARLDRLNFPQRAVEDVRALVAINAMYNQFYKLPDLSSKALFGGMPVGLRGHTIASTMFDEITIELIGVAMGTLNGCKTCTSGHAHSASNAGLEDEAILEAIQCASTVLAGCTFLNSL
jgi:alkyl hydroperoxide reductase subunit D